jgi:siroheme synthase (precorrin-2 oxidase/ferrochelatase)
MLSKMLSLFKLFFRIRKAKIVEVHCGWWPQPKDIMIIINSTPISYIYPEMPKEALDKLLDKRSGEEAENLTDTLVKLPESTVRKLIHMLQERLTEFEETKKKAGVQRKR